MQWASLIAQLVKNPPAMQEMQVCLGSSQQGLEAGVEEGPQDRCADVLAGAHPLNCKGLLREKGKRGAGDTGTRESPLILG